MWDWLSQKSTTSSNSNSSSSNTDGCPIDHTSKKSSITNRDKLHFLNKDNLMYSEESLQSPPEFSCSAMKASPESVNVGAPQNDNVLSPSRVVSSIPRTDSQENWKYPSERMFFNAMHRKGHNPHSRDMQTVVMMHNIVNEQTWQEVKKWEKEFHCDCEEITLKRFRGKPDNASPKSLFKSMLLGYGKPFDRHDWTIDRCGKEVTYVIDFYPGGSSKQKHTNSENDANNLDLDQNQSSTTKSAPEPPVSIYLDVRPSLDSWENFLDRLKKSFKTGSIC